MDELPAVIWMRDRARTRGPRPAHTLDEIAQAAMSLADDEGLDAVSIRAVARVLGAGAASLYRYIDSKDDLFDLMVDAASAGYDLPERPSGDWRADVTLLAERGRAVHLEHPWAGSLSAQVSWGPHVQVYMEFFLAALAPTPLTLREKLEFMALVSSWVANFAQVERQAIRGPMVPMQAVAQARHLQQIAANPELPHLASAAGSLLQADPADADPDRLFARGLDRLLASIPTAPHPD